MEDERPIAIDVTGSDIHAEAARIRERGAVARVVLPDGVEAWAVSSPGLLRRLLVDTRVSKDARQHWPAWINGEISPQWPLFSWVAVQNMFTAYGGEHKRLRTLVSKAFTARWIAALQPRIEEITTYLVECVAQAGQQSEVVDLRKEFCYPLPIRVISELFGMPDELRGIVDSLCQAPTGPDEATATYAKLYAVMGELVAGKRQSPANDLTSALIAARDDEGGNRLSEQELLDTLVLLIGAGFETTVNLIDKAVHALLTNPEQLTHVRAGRASWEDVVEETLRMDPPAANLPLRYAVEDLALGELGGPHGVVIRAGEAILAAYAAAGRSPEHYGFDADRFDVTKRSVS